jgi:uncharacterized cupin superfamily protein
MSDKPSPAFDPLTIEAEVRNPYPPPNDTALNGKSRRALGDPRGLTAFGVNLAEMAPGSVSALRHWHSAEDEFIYITEGTPTLVTDAWRGGPAAGHVRLLPGEFRRRPPAGEPVGGNRPVSRGR